MNALTKTLLTAAIALAASAALAPAQNVLDEGLGNDTPKKQPAPPDPAPAAQKPPEPKPTRPKMPDLVSPEAAKTVDDADLVKKLTNDAPDDPADKMKEVMDRMGQVQTRLAEQKDPGLVTQETQRRIVTDLDVMIELMKKNQQKSSGKPKDPKPGDGPPQKSESQGQQSGGPPSQAMGGDQAAQDSNMRPGSASTPGQNDTDIHQTGSQWGNLPPGDRELVAHGANEHYLPEYKDMINKYYQALAEIGKSAKSNR